MKLRRSMSARKRRCRREVKRRVVLSASGKPLLLDIERIAKDPLASGLAAWIRRSPRSWQLAYRTVTDHGCQSGQALSEMLLLTSALLGLCLVFNYLDVRRVAVLESAHQSRYRAFAQARGDVSEAGAAGVAQAAVLPAAATHVGSSVPARQLASDWLQLGQGWVSSAPSGSKAGIGIDRRTVLAAGAGHGHDAEKVQQRVAASALGWRNAALASQQAAVSLNTALGRQDAPWARRQVAPDWLAPWADIGSPVRGKP